jgi:hypothetical protein
MILLTVFCFLSYSGILYFESHRPMASTDMGQIYESVPIADRDALRIGVEKIIAAHKNGTWDGVFETLDNERHITVDQFRREGDRAQIMEFRLNKIVYIPPGGYWAISGCARFKHAPSPGKSASLKSGLTARRTKEGWRFTTIAVSSSKETGGVEACIIQDR